MFTLKGMRGIRVEPADSDNVKTTRSDSRQTARDWCGKSSSPPSLPNSMGSSRQPSLRARRLRLAGETRSLNFHINRVRLGLSPTATTMTVWVARNPRFHPAVSPVVALTLTSRFVFRAERAASTGQRVGCDCRYWIRLLRPRFGHPEVRTFVRRAIGSMTQGRLAGNGSAGRSEGESSALPATSASFLGR
jgi:hypothetical protein